MNLTDYNEAMKIRTEIAQTEAALSLWADNIQHLGKAQLSYIWVYGETHKTEEVPQHCAPTEEEFADMRSAVMLRLSRRKEALEKQFDSL